MVIRISERRLRMSMHVSWKLPLVLLLGITTIQAYSQTVPEARRGNIPLSIGGGITDYSLDWGYGRRMLGITAWADWHFTSRSRFLRGVGLEAEATDLNWNRPSSLPKMRHDTAQGGGTYTWQHFRNFSPYAKMLVGIGSIDFPAPPGYPSYTHDTFTIFSPGGGIEYGILNRVSVRGDYEYQFWRQTFGPHDLNPNGFTIGASYHFGRAPGRMP
jgi:opacity protein-like surface antigen